MVTKPPPTLAIGPLLHLRGDEVKFNPWNPNKMDGFMYAKAVESVQTFGMVDPVLVRELGKGKYEIIDGEHRAKACIDLGLPIPAHSVGKIADGLAKRLTIALNEIHGTASPVEMGKLLDDLLATSSIEDLLVGLPMTEDTIKAFTDAATVEWPTSPLTPPTSSPAAPSAGDERWVERTYRVPQSVADVLDEAIAKAKGTGVDVTDAQALEIIAAEYMAG